MYRVVPIIALLLVPLLGFTSAYIPPTEAPLVQLANKLREASDEAEKAAANAARRDRELTTNSDASRTLMQQLRENSRTLEELKARVTTLESRPTLPPEDPERYDPNDDPRLDGPRVINAATGSALDSAPGDRAVQLHPKDINVALSAGRADTGVFHRDTYRADAKAAAMRVIEAYISRTGAAPWGVYCDEIAVAGALNPVTLFWWASNDGQRPAGTTAADWLAKSDAVFATMIEINLGIQDAAAELGVNTVAIQGTSLGLVHSNEPYLRSFMQAAFAFRVRHPEHPIQAWGIWDYYPSSAGTASKPFVDRSVFGYAGNRLAVGVPVIRFYFPHVLKLDQPYANDGTSWPLSMAETWWRATPDDDPKGVWVAGHGPQEALGTRVTPPVLEFLETLR